jgi:predicted nucleic acid-binding protein
MIILDTEVVSALIGRDDNSIVVGWLDNQPAQSIWTTAVTVFEIQLGLELLAQGRRRRQLEEAFARALDEDFEGRTLPLEHNAARAAALIAVRQRRAGRVAEIRDAQIAGIAAARRATLATRNIRRFANLGLTLVGPWAAG